MHVLPYGEVNLNMTSRLDLGVAVADAADGLAQQLSPRMSRFRGCRQTLVCRHPA